MLGYRTICTIAFFVAVSIPVSAHGQSGAEAAADEGLVVSVDRVKGHVPDPDLHRQEGAQRLEQARRDGDTVTADNLKRVDERVDSIRRPQQLRLSLQDVLQRTLANSYAIEVQSFNPAVEATRVVEAEAAFDAVLFSDFTKNKVDQPTASQLYANESDSFDLTGGVRKLLPTGAQISAYYNLRREKSSLSYQEINPAYTSNLALELRQPLLRGFGIDVNRSMIHVRKNNRSISDLAFQRQIRDTLVEAERLYWELMSARREVVIAARLLADFEGIYDYLVARQSFDVTPVQLAATKANLEQSRAEFVQTRAAVFDAEDNLIALMNDPEINLADDIEIITEDFPSLSRIVVDRVAEAQTALDNRPEIREGELQIANAKIQVGQSRNAELPQLDLSLTYRITGLAGTADRSFDEVSGHNYTTYVVGVQFEVPIGNRSPRAVRRRSELEYAQAKVALKTQIEQTILEVNQAVRALNTSHEQIAPSLESAEAREREVESIVARAERKDINTLNSELSARRSLAETRRAMLQILTNYNMAIVALERAKGTLLEYDNVVVTTE